MKLHFGVQDIPYVNTREPGSKAVSGTQTTGDVAQWLENKYHPMEVFYREHEDEIANSLAHHFAGMIEQVASGAPIPDAGILAGSMGEIEEGFRLFLEQEEMANLGFPGVPTQAALEGRTSRRKSKRGARRPSFIDTGLYQKTFKAWVDE